MPRICFKPRHNSRFVQLVRHCYNPDRQRSQTLTVGSLDRAADPARLPTGIKLSQEETLSPDDLAHIRGWLLQHGDPQAARERAALVAALRAEIAQEACDPDPFQDCLRSLQRLAQALPDRAAALLATGKDPWKILRPLYRENHHAWQAVVQAAQQAGIAISRKGSDAEASDETAEKNAPPTVLPQPPAVPDAPQAVDLRAADLPA